MQLQLINKQIDAIINSNNFYKKKLRVNSIKTLKTIEDFKFLPFSDKTDIQEGYPLGLAVVPEDKIVRIHTTSGTTGKPVVIPYTANDIKDWSVLMERCLRLAGLTNKDRVQITPGFGLWTAGSGFQYGIERIGAMAIPTGPGNTIRQIQIMKDFKTTVLVATSSYALMLSEKINMEEDKSKLQLRKGIFGSECWGKKTRDTICNNLGIITYDIYGLTEVYGPGIGISCSQNHGIHYWDDYIFIEIIDPVTLEPLSDGEWGEVVITTLRKEGAPLIRYRTHDISRILPESCQCGSVFPRIDVIRGRTDDMIKIKGVNFYPSQIEEIIEKFPEILGEYQIKLDRIDNIDSIQLCVELKENSCVERIEKNIAEKIKSSIGINLTVKGKKMGDLPRNQGKTKRIIDDRKV